MITKEKVKTYTKLLEELEYLSQEIFDYFSQYPILCSFYGYARYEQFDIQDNNLYIKYYDHGYDIYDCDNFYIPLKHVYDNTWKQYIDDMEEEKQQRIYGIKLKEQKKKKEERMKLYQELRAEFENNDEYTSI